MCTNIGSTEDVEGVLFDVLMLASSDPNVIVDRTLVDAQENMLIAEAQSPSGQCNTEEPNSDKRKET